MQDGQAMRDWVSRVLGVEMPNRAQASGAAPVANGADSGPLSAELGALMRRIPEAAGTDASIRGELLKLAGEAIASLKGKDLKTTSDLVARLRETLRAALDGAGVGIGPVTPQAKPEGGTSQPGARKSGDELLALLRDAKDDVDAGLEKLRAELLATGDERMARIAKQGLYGMAEGGGAAVRLMKALFDLRGSGDAAGSDAGPLYDAARKAAAAYKAALLADRVVDLVDRNPFAVRVGLRARLAAALETIENAG